MIAPGAYRFPLGNINDVMLHKSAALENELPIKAPMNWLVEQEYEVLLKGERLVESG